MSQAGEGQRKGQHYFLVYCGGLVAGMMLDYDIRSHSRNTRNLDGLMKTMYLAFNRTDRKYTNADLLAELNKFSGKDYTEFFNRHINRGLPQAHANCERGSRVAWESTHGCLPGSALLFCCV